MTKSIRVSLCDSSPAFRCGLKQILARDPNIDTVAELSRVEDLPEKLVNLDQNILIFDPDDNREFGLDCLKRFRESRPDVKTIIFTACNDRDLIMEAMEMGVRGFKLKTASAEDLLASIHAVYNGGASLDSCVSSALVEHMSAANEAPVEELLSKRESEVLALLSKGKSNNDIAAELAISTRTVKFHVSSIFTKLNVKNRTEAAAKWMH